MMRLIKRLLGGKSVVVIAVLFHIVITALMLMPSAEIGYIDISQLDKLIHAGIYVCLFILWASVTIKREASKPSIFWVAIALFIYGIVIEVLQEKWIVTRTFDFWDIVANSVGIVIGYIVFHQLTTRLNLKN